MGDPCKPDLSAHCEPLRMVILGFACRRSGVHLITIWDHQTDTFRSAVMARKSAKHPGVIFRLCPYCGVEFDAGVTRG